MSGALWAALAGVGFGVFQAVNRYAGRGMDVYLSTFLQMLVSTVVLGLASLATADLSLLRGLTPWTVLAFGMAGFTHFFLGWTLMNASQQRIGAARTSTLIGTTPLFGVVVAAVLLGELPGPWEVLGIVVVVLGMLVISSSGTPAGIVAGASPGSSPLATLSASLFAIGTALCWAISPVFIRAGLRELPSPLLGLTIGLVPCVIAYGAVLGLRWRRGAVTGGPPLEALGVKLLAGLLVGLATWVRWIALDLAPVGVVLAISQISVPVVMLLTPLLVGAQAERITLTVWLGAALTVGGSLILVLR